MSITWLWGQLSTTPIRPSRLGPLDTTASQEKGTRAKQSVAALLPTPSTAPAQWMLSTEAQGTIQLRVTGATTPSTEDPAATPSTATAAMIPSSADMAVTS